MKGENVQQLEPLLETSPYVELLGLPGSGKTTLTKSISRRHGHLIGFSARRQRTRLSFETAKSLLLDQWAAESLAAYPELFSRVFEALVAVPSVGREREILLNYWRHRVSGYRRAISKETKRAVIVDEGLTQTVFSTLMRLGPQVGAKERSAFAESLMNRLPNHRRVLIFVDTPLVIANERQLASRRSIHRFSNLVGQRKIRELYKLAQETGVITRKIDGGASPSVLSEQLSETLLDALSPRPSLCRDG